MGEAPGGVTVPPGLYTAPNPLLRPADGSGRSEPSMRTEFDVLLAPHHPLQVRCDGELADASTGLGTASTRSAGNLRPRSTGPG